MKVIKLTAPLNRDWSGKFVDEDSYDLLLNEDARVERPDGSLLCVLKKNALSLDFLRSAYTAFKDINIQTRNRGTAAGEEMKPLKRADGSLSKTLVSDPVNSGVIGFLDRSPRFPYCRACSWNLENPAGFEACLPMFKQIWDLYGELDPFHRDLQIAVASKTSPDFLIRDTGFTTVTINKNFRTACHRDAGNLKEAFSLINVIRRGVWSGANLVFPDWRVAAKLDSSDLLLFDPNEFHGNTPLKRLSKNAERWSLVYYYRENILYCGTAEAELARVKSRVAGDELVHVDLKA